MAQSAAIRRLKKEYTNLSKDPAPGILAQPLETNFLHAHFLLHGTVFHDTPYEGGVYHGLLKFPSDYPMKPPTIIMRTPSGRFTPDQKICFSMSDFHPELWNPMWSIRSILLGFVSFMNSDDITTGGIEASAATRIDCATVSLEYCRDKDDLAFELFRQELEDMVEQRLADGNDDNVNANDNGNGWPPQRPAAKDIVKPKVDDAPVRRRRIRNTTRLGDDKPSASARTMMISTNKNKSISSDPMPLQHPVAAAAAVPNNTAKNKKKRNKEKRKKLVQKFLSTLSERVPPFVTSIRARLFHRNEIDASISKHTLDPDHVCWRTETMEEYTELVAALRAAGEECSLLVESAVGGRSIATFRLHKAIQCGHQFVGVVEVPAPKDGSFYQSGLEHVEFVIGNGGGGGGGDGDGECKASSPVNDDSHQLLLNAVMDGCPGIRWNTRAMDKAINPDVSAQVELVDFGTCTAKFHLFSLADVIEFELSERS